MTYESHNLLLQYSDPSLSKELTVMAQTPTTLFPSIGTVADQTDNLQTRETDGSIGNTTLSTLSANDNEEKVVQEVESLCMQCGEQVSLIFFFFFFAFYG